jgi:hypothetical protein
MKVSLIAPVFAAAIAPAATAAADTSQRHLVYAFTYGVQQNVSARDSATVQSVDQNGIGAAGSGISHYQGSLGDTGTMTVDVRGLESDGGLVVSISEDGKDTRRAPPATCVVYPNTNVLCDPSKTVNTEEYTLLRFLSPSFVNPGQMDAKQHWQISQSAQAGVVTADYAIEHSDGGMLQIQETRSIRPQAPRNMTLDGETHIAYDVSRRIPSSIDEYVTQRNDRGAGGASTTIYQTTLRLMSDSSQ